MDAAADLIRMLEAVRLARRGYPAPNPRVGCLLVNGGEVVGRGWHPFAGGPHAEVMALEQAGGRAHGATAFVTLEPCNHHGRTGPCSEALIRAGVVRVVYATPDPNPRAQGGAQRLREAGVEVVSGVGGESAEKVNAAWLRAHQLKRPFVTVKVAASLDGRIALPSGESQWITGAAARRAGHQLRAEMGAVLVGRGTVELDNPGLNARIPGVRNPVLKVILDPQVKLKGNEKLFQTPGEVWWVVAPGRAWHACHVEAPFSAGGFDLRALLQALWRQGLTGLLVEGGRHTISSFFREGLVDRLELFVAPKVLGDGPAWIEGLGLESLELAPRFQPGVVRRVGEDLRYTVDWPQGASRPA